MDPRADPACLLPPVQARERGVLELLEALVNLDSGTWSPAGVNRVADAVQARLAAGGWAVERLPHQPGDGLPRLGDLLVGRRRGALPVAAGGRRLLLMAHMDTVFDDGCAAERPFRVADGRAYGPGVADDKAGLACGLAAVEALGDAGFDRFAELTLVCSPDEEIGSPFSKPVLERLAAEHDVGLGLEAARSNGALVTARKGIAAFELDVRGRAAHAGVRPEAGVNAVLEAAHKTVALQALNRRWPGVTCNVGVLRGGSRVNVVADRALLQVELRAATQAGFAAAEAEVARIVAAPAVPGALVAVRPLHRHRPMERTEAVAALAAAAKAVAAGLGFEVGEAATGGAGDANTTAAVGLPTLDGLAPIGGEAHGPAEWLDLASVVPRTALLAALLARLGQAT